MSVNSKRPMTANLTPNRIAQTVPQVTRGLAPGASELGRAVPVPRAAEPQTLQYTQTDIRTYFTQVGGTHRLLSAQGWIRVRLLLETAGPVAIGTKAGLTPVLSGIGVLLDTDIPYETVLTRGGSLYVAAEGVNRIKVTVEPLPWLETISLQIGMAVERLGAVANGVGVLPSFLNLFRKKG